MQIKQKFTRLLFYLMPGNPMTDELVPKAHTNHATLKFTLPVLTITGQAIMDTAWSMLLIVIIHDNLALVTQCCHLPLAGAQLNPLHLIHPTGQASSTLRSSTRKRQQQSSSDVLLPLLQYRISERLVSRTFPLWTIRFYTVCHSSIAISLSLKSP